MAASSVGSSFSSIPLSGQSEKSQLPKGITEENTWSTSGPNLHSNRMAQPHSVKNTKKHNDDTFGDQERKAVKLFRQAVQSSELTNKEEVSHLRSIAQIYKQSALGTQNMYNVLRTCGLLNLCLMKLTSDDVLHDEVLDELRSFEVTAMRRCLKLKSTGIGRFEAEVGKECHLQYLQEIRDLYAADFVHLASLLSNLPTEKSLLDPDRTAALDQDDIQQQIVAAYSVMSAESEERVIELLDVILTECEAIAGPAPCRYALSVNSRWRLGCYSPYEPVSCFLLIERDGAACKAYYRTLLTLFAMKIINLTETPLSLLNIKSLSWYTEEMQRKPGLSLFDFIDDTEKKYFTSIPMESLFTIKELSHSAKSYKLDERQAVYEVCDGVRLVSGDYRLFKELSALRYTVLQREQADREFKSDVMRSLACLLNSVEFLNTEFIRDASISALRQQDISLFCTKLLKILFDINKKSTAQSNRMRLEELSSSLVDFPYTQYQIESQTVDGVLRTTSQQCVESPAEGKDRIPSPSKSNSLPPIRPTKPTKKETSKLDQQLHGRTQPKNASNRVTYQPKPAKKPAPVIKKQPVIIPFTRRIGSVQSFKSETSGMMGPKSFHPLLLADVLSSCLQVAKGVPDGHPNLSQSHITKIYCSLLRIIIPLVDELRLFSLDSSLIPVFRKTVAHSDLTVIEDELAAAYRRFHDGKYPGAGEAVVRYIENRSDVTFIGEPFPADILEILQELRNSDVVPVGRCTQICQLLAQCQFQMGRCSMAAKYLENSLMFSNDPRQQSDIYHNMAKCFVETESWQDAFDAINKSIELFRGLQNGSNRTAVGHFITPAMKLQASVARKVKD